MSAPLLEMRNITKTFPGVVALSNVSFSVNEGEIHCLVGENGAGKSTLMKVLSGVYPHGEYTGDIVFNGRTQEFRGIADSEKAGIAIIYQELALVPEMTVYENIFLGHELRAGFLVDMNETIKKAGEMLAKIRLDVNPETKVRDLGVGKRQLVEIAKALSREVRLLVLDEPTAALNEDDCENLFEILRGLKSHGVTCVMISHKLREVTKIGDVVTVLRDGQTICTLDARKGEVSEGVLIKHMVGREIDNVFPKRTHHRSDEVVLEVKDWNVEDPKLGRSVLRDVSFNVKKGEIVGFSGLMGSGRTELARSIFGNPDGYRISGKLAMKRAPRRFSHPQEAIQSGVAYATEDRKLNGLILIQDVKQNITLANLREIARNGIVDINAEVKVATEYKNGLSIKTPSLEQTVGNLSGGNQQKVSVGMTGKDLEKVLRANIREYGMYIALVVIMVIFTITTNGLFISSRNIGNLMNQTGYIAVLAVGMTLVIVIRHIDLSVGFLAGFLGAIGAIALVFWHVPIYVVIPFVLVLGVFAGLLTALPVAYMGIPAFVTSLAGWLI